MARTVTSAIGCILSDIPPCCTIVHKTIDTLLIWLVQLASYFPMHCPGISNLLYAPFFPQIPKLGNFKSPTLLSTWYLCQLCHFHYQKAINECKLPRLKPDFSDYNGVETPQLTLALPRSLGAVMSRTFHFNLPPWCMMDWSPFNLEVNASMRQCFNSHFELCLKCRATSALSTTGAIISVHTVKSERCQPVQYIIGPTVEQKPAWPAVS